MVKEIPKSVECKIFKIFGLDVECHILSDGRRVVSSDSLTQLLALMAIGFSDADLEASDLDHFIFWCRTK